MERRFEGRFRCKAGAPERIFFDVEMQRRFNTFALSTLNKQPDSAEVFKVGAPMT